MEPIHLVWSNLRLAEVLAEMFDEDVRAKLPSAAQLEADVTTIAGWITEGLAGLAANKSNLVQLMLGDAPEFLSIEGYQLFHGQASADDVLAQLAEDEWDWLDDYDDVLDADAIETLGYHKVTDLPHPPFDLDEWDEEEEGALSYENLEDIWSVLVLLALGRVIRGGALPPLAAGLTAAPLFVGFEDAPMHVATLTPAGWVQPPIPPDDEDGDDDEDEE